MKIDGAQNRKQSFPALDGLRGLAALWVLVGHVTQVTLYNRFVWLLLNNGLAVDLFMLLSGFLMYVLHGDVGRLKVGDFWIRRIFRLAPLYYTWLLISFAFAPFLKVFTAAVWAGAAHVHTWPIDTSLQNFLFHLTLTFGLSPSHQQNTFLPDWSLTLEAQFYLFFPLFIWGAARFGLIGFAILTILLQCAVVFIFPNLFEQYIFPTLLPLKLHMFVAGMLLARLTRKNPNLPISYALLLVCCALPIPFFDVKYVVCRLVMVVIMICCTQEMTWRPAIIMVEVLSRPALRTLGELSYGMYLIHTMVMYAAYYVLLAEIETRHVAVFWIVLSVTFAISLAISSLCYRYVERPGIELGRRILRYRSPQTQ